MGQNSLDSFAPLDSPRILATAQVLFDFFNDVPTNVINDFTWAGVTLPALVVQLSPRSVRSPYVFDKIRSVSFSLQFMNQQYQPGDLSIWIPETNFLHRIQPNVLNVVPMDPPEAIVFAHTWPMVSGQINVNAQPDSSLYLIKEFDSNPSDPHPFPFGAWCSGVFNVQNWEVSPILTGVS